MHESAAIVSHVEDGEQPRLETIGTRWSLAKRIIFRFASAYLLLFGFPFLLLPLAVIFGSNGTILQKYMSLLQPLVGWVGRHILGISRSFSLANIGSGDQTYYWVQTFFFLLLAAIATLTWSLLDRKRPNYEKLHRWMRLMIRFILALLMITYGAQKAIPVQMPPPSLTRLLQPYGEFSPMTVLWSFMGSSPAYTSVTGCIELLGGILLIFSRTTLLGSIISFAAMTQVFMLNLFYDVPVKLLSFHMLLMSVFLLAPHLQRLANVILLNRRVDPYPTLPIFRRWWLNRGLLVPPKRFFVRTRMRLPCRN